MSAIDVMIYWCLWVLEILKVKGFDYSCIISLISKNKAINLMQNSEKVEHYKTWKIYVNI